MRPKCDPEQTNPFTVERLIGIVVDLIKRLGLRCFRLAPASGPAEIVTLAVDFSTLVDARDRFDAAAEDLWVKTSERQTRTTSEGP
jgi:hypothetical protein